MEDEEAGEEEVEDGTAALVVAEDGALWGRDKQGAVVPAGSRQGRPLLLRRTPEPRTLSRRSRSRTPFERGRRGVARNTPPL